MQQEAVKKEVKKKKNVFLRVLMGLVITAAVLAALAAICWYVVFRVNTFTLEVQMFGENDILLEYGEPYVESGARALLYSTLFWEGEQILDEQYLRVITDYREDALGKFTVTYEANIMNLTAQVQRHIRVIDTEPPVLTLTEPTGYMVLPGNIFEEPGFKAIDNFDGDITHRVICKYEDELITYAVTDSSGNPAVAQREVPGYDPVPPVITLTGGERMVLTTGTPYIEPGYTAVDSDGTDLTAQVTVEGEVDWLTPGIYPVVYTVYDEMQNKTTVARKVTVKAQPRPEEVKPTQPTIYLTFDDGPGPYTETLLELLDLYDAKATFFVVDNDLGHLMKKIVDKGHAIGIHSTSHNYEEIYSSPEAFFQDLYKMQDIIKRNTGVETTLLRFPGGSSNEISRNYYPGIMSILTEAVQDAGFQYFDWNVLSGDAGDTTSSKKVAENVINGIAGNPYAVVLQHDIHRFSVDAVEDILLWGQNNGYVFEALTPNSPGCHQKVMN